MRGIWWSKSSQQARFWLESRGLTEISVEPYSSTLEDLRVQGDALALFYRQLAVMFVSGIPLADAFRMAAYGTDPRMVGVCLILEDQIREGGRLSTAFRLFPGVFDKVTVGLLAAAERSGRLGHALELLADAQERRVLLYREARAALTYPCVLAVSSLILLVVSVFIMAPMDQELLGSLGVEVPFLSRILASTAKALTSPWIPMLVLLSLGSAFAVLRRRDMRHLAIEWAKGQIFKVPPVRVLLQKSTAVRHLDILGLLLESGGTIDVGLKFMLEACEYPQEKIAVKELRHRIIQGADFGEALEASRLLPPLVSSLLRVGYETGKIESTIRHGRALCEEDIRLALQTSSKALEPVLLAGAGLLAGLVVVGTALPMIKLIETL